MDYHNEIYNMDCLAGMGMLPDACIDMVLTDLPYGTTDGDWDIMLPLPELWQQLYRVAKPRAAMVFTAAQPFTTQLISSNRKHFRYCWYWHKNQVTGFPFAKYQPLRCVEDISGVLPACTSIQPTRIGGPGKTHQIQRQAIYCSWNIQNGWPGKRQHAEVYKLSPAGAHLSLSTRGPASHAKACRSIRVFDTNLY